jgi:hypothetical protein
MSPAMRSLNGVRVKTSCSKAGNNWPGIFGETARAGLLPLRSGGQDDIVAR